MMQILKTLRDFLDEETLKWLPSHLQAGNFILLTQNKKMGADKPWKQVIQVFDRGGTYIGEISDPDFIPKNQ